MVITPVDLYTGFLDPEDKVYYSFEGLELS